VKATIFMVLCFTLIFFGNLMADSPGKTKIIVGSVLLGGGAALTAHAFSEFCLQSCGTEDAEAYGGLAMVGTGTALLIWGLIERNKAKKSNARIENSQSRNLLVGITPGKDGVAAGIRFRW